jgi:hypothetical protein
MFRRNPVRNLTGFIHVSDLNQRTTIRQRSADHFLPWHLWQQTDDALLNRIQICSIRAK